MFASLKSYLDSVIARDPAARSRLQVLLCSPSVHALFFHRLAHLLWRLRLCLVAQLVSQGARFLTGIEIHPAARIGRRLFIDHGMGVVIGESVEIGDDVTLYQGVTLGGIAPAENSDRQRQRKRHPTLCDRVIVGSGAQILGAITVARLARIGANAVVTKNVPQGATVGGIPARVLSRDSSEHPQFRAYATLPSSWQDPVDRALEKMGQEIEILRAEMAALREELPSKKNRPPSAPAPSVSKPRSLKRPASSKKNRVQK